MKTKLLLLLFFIPFFCFGQSTQAVELIIKNANCKEGSSYLKFDLSIKNNTKDTIVIVKPMSNQFGNHPRAEASSIVGELAKPYQIKLIKEGVCLEPKTWEIAKAEPRLSWFSKYKTIEIPPGQRSKEFSLSFSLDFNFCKEVAYRLQISYEPKYKMLTKEEKAKLLEYHHQYVNLAVEAKKYLSEEDLVNGKWNQEESTMKYIVNSVSFEMEKLSLMKMETKSVEVLKK